MMDALSRDQHPLSVPFFMPFSLAGFWRSHCTLVCGTERARGRIDLTTTLFSGETGLQRGEAKQRPLGRPLQRNRPTKRLQCECWRLVPRENRVNQIGSQKTEP